MDNARYKSNGLVATCSSSRKQFLALTFIILTSVSCTQSDISTEPAQNLREDERLAVNTSSSLIQSKEEQDKNLPVDKGNSDISFMYADTDGDKMLDGIEICQGTNVCITRGRTHEQIIYSHPSWGAVRIIEIQDIDGRAGEEIVLHVSNDEGGFVCLCIVDDANRLIRTYQDGWRSVLVQIVADTDGLAGKEIVLLAKDARGVLQCLCIIHDRNGEVQSYQDGEWASVTSLWSEDTDGSPGMEIVLEIHNSVDQLYCVCVIHDATQTLMKYANPAWTVGQIILLTDTDGKTGTEIVLGYRSSLGSGIAVIHDDQETIRTYAFRGDLPAIQHVGPSSRHKGNDLCVLVEQNELLILAERYEQPVPVETCDQGFHSPSGATVHKKQQLWRPSG